MSAIWYTNTPCGTQLLLFYVIKCVNMDYFLKLTMPIKT